LIETLSLYIDAREAVLVHLAAGIGRRLVKKTASFPYPPNEIGDRSREAVAGKVVEYLLVNRIRTKEVALVIPDHELLFKKVVLPAAAGENLDQVLEYEFENYFPFKREDALFDYLVLKRTKGVTEDVHVLLATLKRERYEFFRGFTDRMGLNLVRIEPAVSAEIPAILSLVRKKKVQFPLMLVHPNERAWEISLWKDSATLEWKRVSREPDEGLAELLSDRARTPMNGLQAKSVSCALLGPEGNGARELPEPFQHLNLEESFQQVGWPSYTPGVLLGMGAGLRDMGSPTPGLDLLPPEKRKRKRRGGLYLFAFLGILVMVGAMALLITPYLQARRTLNVLEQKYSALSPQLGALERRREQIDRIRSDMEVLTRVPRRNALDVLLHLTPLVPEDSWVQNFTLNNDVIQIKGYSKNASELIPVLENSPHFKDVEFTSPVVKRGSLENFNITMKIES
jgi:Tfp pilus assembly protein PilN